MDKYAEGRAEGRVEGRAEGRVEGRAEGRAEGIIEEKRGMAKKLLRRGVPINIVVEDTDLTREEVEVIKADLDKSQQGSCQQ